MSSHLTFGQFTESHFEEIEIFQVSNAYPIPADFGGVGWTYALFGRADFVTSESMFGNAVDGLVEVKDYMSSIGEEDTSFSINPLMFEVVQFIKEGGEMNDDSIANDAGGLFVEDSGGEEVEFVLFAFDDDGVACVGSSGDAGADVVLLVC